MQTESRREGFRTTDALQRLRPVAELLRSPQVSLEVAKAVAGQRQAQPVRRLLEGLDWQ